VLSNISVDIQLPLGGDRVVVLHQAIAESIGCNGAGAPLAHLFGQLTSLFLAAGGEH
jgi:hypothetical protein